MSGRLALNALRNPVGARGTLRVLSALLTYPDAPMRSHLPEMADVLRGERALPAARESELIAFIEQLARTDPYEVEAEYVQVFDRGRGTSLHLFEHVHGDSRERGQALVDLKQVYERAGFQLAPDELPDYLPAMLEYLSCRSAAEAREMLGDCAHVLRAVGERLAGRASGYAAVYDALLGLAGERGLDWSKTPPPAEPEPALDDDWMDAPAFGPGSGRNSGAQPATAVLRFVPPGNKRVS